VATGDSSAFLPPPNPADAASGRTGCCVEGADGSASWVVRQVPADAAFSSRLPAGVVGVWLSVLHAAWGTGEAPWRASGRLGQVSGAVSRRPLTPHSASTPHFLRIEQLRPPRPESFREDIVFNFLRPASLKVEGPHAVGSRGPIFCLVVSIYPRFALLVFENL
jgi:hypothetical protein